MICDSYPGRIWQRLQRTVTALIAVQAAIALLLLASMEYTLALIIEAKVFPYARVMEVTAYTAGPESTGKFAFHPEFGVTASTYRLNIGLEEKCVAAPPEIDFGTRIFVPGYGVGTVMDRGEAITQDKLDVYFDDVDTARQWGRQQLQVLIFP